MSVQREESDVIEVADRDFERVRQLIKQFAGVSLAASKRNMVHSRLSRRMRECGETDMSAYLRRVEADDEEAQQFINALTTHLTSFFREPYHFPILEAFLKGDPGGGPGERPARRHLWCAAASTGEEPYSIAMTAARALGGADRFDLLATDVDTNCLAKAGRGTYPIEAVDPVSPEDRRDWLLKGTGANAGRVRIKPALARSIRFARFNLMEAQWRFEQPFDAVFCRNVLIYFDPPTKLEVMRRMHTVIRPGGLLFIGHSESFNDVSGLFKLEGKTVYRRLAGS